MKPSLPATPARPAPPASWAFGPWVLHLPDGPLLKAGVPQALGGRALAVLALLVSERGAVVDTQALLDHVWPDRTVEEGNLYVHVAELRKLLGRDAVRSVYGRGYCLALPLSHAPAAAPSAAPLFGRADELASLHAALSARAAGSFVSLVGMGGIGKSALARHLADEAGASTACLVELAALPREEADANTDADTAPLATAVLQALGLSAGSTPPLERLLAAYGDASEAGEAAATQPLPGLLLLDNCEHLARNAARLVAALLAAAPGLRIVTTSQRPLELPGEHVLRLLPLALPQLPGLAAAQASGAVALFVSRTQAAQPRFVLSDANLADVLAICTRLDGIPLALELAAARMPLLGAAGLRERLHERFRLLTQGAANAPSRHQTLQATLDWSHALLALREQVVLRRLALFRGGFTADAAQALACDAELDEWAVLEALDRLVAQSFVVPHAGGTPDAPRFTLLDTVREHATHAPPDGDDAQALALRHVQIYTDLARAHSGSVGGSQAGSARSRLALDHDNLRVALDWCIAHQPLLGLALAAALGPFWRERGHHLEALQRTSTLLARTDANTHAEARAALLPHAAMLAQECGDAALVHRLATEAALTAHRLGDQDLEARSHTLLAHAAWMDDDHAAARGHHSQALLIRREQGNLERMAESLNNIACSWLEEGQVHTALPLLDEALPLARQSGHRWTESAVLETLGEVDFALGRFDTARRFFIDNLAIQRELGHAYRIACGLQLLASAELRLQRPGTAAAALLEAITLSRQHGFAAKTPQLYAAAAECLLALGRPDAATMLLGALDVQGPQAPAALPRLDREHQAQALAQSRARLAEAAWQQLWFEGRRLSRDDAAARACAALQG